MADDLPTVTGPAPGLRCGAEGATTSIHIGITWFDVADFCRAYGPQAGAEVIDVVPDRLQALIEFIRDQASRGNEAFQQHVADGHTDLYEADISYVRVHRDTLRAAFDVD